jgi:hypothetical protein
MARGLFDGHVSLSVQLKRELRLVEGREQGSCARALTTPKSCMVKRSHCENRAGGPS